MFTSKVKKSLSLLLTFLMIITMIPVTIAAEENYPTMMRFTAASSGDFHKYYNQVYTVTFLDEIDETAMNNAIEKWDISFLGDGSVMSWMYLNEQATAQAGKNRYDVYIAGDGGVGANAQSGFIFYLFSELKEVRGLENFKTKNAVTFASMFENCYKLEKVDIKRWNTENVTSLENMFKNCYELTELDLSSFNTSKVTTMRFMFYLCKKLTTIYAGEGWTTESLANLYDGIFNCCYAKFGVTEAEYGEAVKNGVQFDASADKATYEEGGYLTYKAPEEYTVTYEFIGDVIPDGVTVPDKAVYREDSTVAVADEATAEGYVFSGWSTEDATVEDGEFTINSDVHFTGSWEKLYKVEYKYTEGFEVPADAPELPGPVYYSAGESVDRAGIPYAYRHVFVGWTTDDTEVVGDMFTMPENDVVFYGYFKIPVESIEILSPEQITLNKDETEKINVYVKPEDATIKDIEYSSSDESVVIVDEYGNIKAVGEGTATVTVKSADDPEKLDSIEITVKIPVTELTVNKTQITLKKGEEDSIIATVLPEDATNKNVIYETDKPDIITIDENGKIIAKNDGTVVITVKSEDNPEVKKTVTVTVKTPVTELTAPEELELIVGEEVNAEAKVNEDATNKELIYESEDPGIVKVDSHGNIVAVGEGETVITVTSKDNPDITKEIVVKVNNLYKVSYRFIGALIPTDVTAPAQTEHIGGSTVSVEEEAAAEGYVFSGWSTNDAVVNDGVFTINNNVEFVGSWRKLYKITYEYEGEVPENAPVLPAQMSSVSGEFITVNSTPSVAGYTFSGWKTEDADVEDGRFVMPDNDVVFKGEFVENEPVTEPTTEPTKPSEPTTEPTQPSEPSTEPTKPSEPTTEPTKPSEPSTEPTKPSEPTTEPTQPSEPTTEPTKPSEPTTEPTKPSEPSTEPTKPSEPSTEPTQPSEPTTEPTKPSEPEYIYNVPESLELNVKESKNLCVTTQPNDGKYLPRYYSSDETVATVDLNGNVKGIRPGVAVITVDFGNGEIRYVTVTVQADPIVPSVPKKFHITFGKTDGIGWYEVSVNGGDFFPQGPNSTLEVMEGSVLVVRVQDMWIDDEFDFYVNGNKVPMDPGNTITVVVDGHMLIGALSMDVEVPDVDESLNIFQKIMNFFKKAWEWFTNLFK